MNDPVPPPVSYADNRLPVGPTGYQVFAYPSDSAGPLNGAVMDDGVRLSLSPTRAVWFRALPMFLVAVVWAAIVLWILPLQRHHAMSLWASRVWTLGMVCAALVIVFHPLWLARRLNRLPWITVD